MVSSININNFICTQLDGFKYREWLNIYIWPTDRTLIDTTTPSQNGPGNNKEGVLLDWSLTIRWFSVVHKTLIWGGLSPLQRRSWSILKPGRLGYHFILAMVITIYIYIFQ